MTNNQRNIWLTVLTKMKAPFWLINKCAHRMDAGADKYGDYDPSTDKRNLLIETEKELLDAINYTLMNYGPHQNNGLLEDLIKLTVKVREMRDGAY